MPDAPAAAAPAPAPTCLHGWLPACGRRRPASTGQLRACAQGGGGRRGSGARRRAGCSAAAAAAAPELGRAVRAPQAGEAAAGLVHVGVPSACQWPPPRRHRLAAPMGGPEAGVAAAGWVYAAAPSVEHKGVWATRVRPPLPH